MSLRLMQSIVCEPPPGPQPEAIKDLSALIVRSLGAPQFYEAGVDKALLQPLVQAAGIRVPEFGLARSPEEAAEVARGLGSQVVVKPSDGTGGRDVIDCETPQAAAAAFRGVLEGAKRNPAMGRQPSVLIQRRIDGLMVGRSSAASLEGSWPDSPGSACERSLSIAVRRSYGTSTCRSWPRFRAQPPVRSKSPGFSRSNIVSSERLAMRILST